MNKIGPLYRKIEKILAGMKFAFFIITLFAIALIYGTFMESYHGADYAGRLVYKSGWFIAIQFAMFVSIFMAVVVRLPMQKRLYGFYTIHAGLIILFIGSLFTYINGIDGSIQLLPNTPAKKILINEDYLQISFVDRGNSYKVPLPYTAKPVNIDQEIEGIKIGQFFPFSENKTVWKEKMAPDEFHSGSYLIFNEMVSQDFTLSLDPSSDFQSTLDIGLLSINYMPMLLKSCFAASAESGLIIWNVEDKKCFSPESKGIKVEYTPKKTKFIAFEHEKKVYTFFPDFSPLAIKKDKTKDLESPFRVLSLNLFTKKATLFIFGDSAAYYKKRKKKWIVEKLSDIPTKLPWMNFKIRMIKFSKETTPELIPTYMTPIQENSKIIAGDLKSIQIELAGKKFWVKSDAPLELSDGKRRLRFQFVNKEIKLPYAITLSRFQMNLNPGTKDPASYESFVDLLDGRSTTGITKHHVFMNNPLKYDDFTFYQSSYFPVGPEIYGSVLSVNYDPGRFFKYLGCLLVVLGAIWHFVIRRKKTRKKI